MKNQLHQLLAVEKELNNKAGIIMKETLTTFNKKADHFDGLVKVYDSYDEAGEKVPPESKEVVTTVADKIKYTSNSVIKAIDAQLSKEETNSGGTVKANLKIDDTDFGELSSISLLSLEKYLTNLRALYKEIPTLDSTKVWNKNKTESKDLYETSEDVKYRTVKVQEPVVVVPPTENHPAQTAMVTKDTQVGVYKTVYKSGRITPKEKSTLLGRIDELLVAVKSAKAKANQAEVNNVKIGKKIFDYINKGVF